MTTSNQTKSSIFWGTTPSDEVYETALHCPTSTAFVARSAKGIIGWFWFENQDGETEMVPLALLATDAVDFGQCRAISYTSYGGVVPQNMRLRNHRGGCRGSPKDFEKIIGKWSKSRPSWLFFSTNVCLRKQMFLFWLAGESISDSGWTGGESEKIADDPGLTRET